MANAEKVVIDILANDYASKKLSSIKTTLDNVSKTQSNVANNNNLSKSYDNASKSAENFGKESKGSLDLSASAFHGLSNIMEAVGGKFLDLGSAIAGVFGAAGLSGMIEKMWMGASQRQTNMLYLIHQKGVAQANDYYNEIMDIVAQLPGDDTFLTNILNMTSAMDKNIKLDNLRELGTAITDFYIASTMKGELPFETQKDIRKYLTTGETKPLRNSLLANEIDLLKDKNTVLERGQALQQALEKNGFAGMSEYESATNELEEFKGHFQKAFADIGTIITTVTQPLLKFYNTIDTLFDSRVSQLIILLATAFIALFTVIGTGMIISAASLRIFETIGMAITTLTWLVNTETSAYGLLNDAIILLVGRENAERISKEGNVLATIKNTSATIKNTLAKKLNVVATRGETVSLWTLFTASLSVVKARLLDIASIIKHVFVGYDDVRMTTAQIVVEGRATAQNIESAFVQKEKNALLGSSINLKLKDAIASVRSTLAIIPNTFAKWRSGEASLGEAFAEEISSHEKIKNTVATIANAWSKLLGIAKTIALTVVTIINTTITYISTGATFSEALAHSVDAYMKSVDTGATYGLITATAILEAELAPVLVVILLIVGAIIALVVVIEKIGEAFGWWEDFGSMFEAISEGINRIWTAFMNSDVVQGIIQYFGAFIDTIKSLFGTIFGLFGGFDGKFDVVQTVIDIFGRLGDAIKWVWNLMDDWSNSPLGIISWLNPLGILLFHLDEIGSYLEDVRDAINIFSESTEFQEMVSSFWEAIDELKEPFMEIWDLINEVISLFSEIFSSEDPQGQGTEDRINAIVEVFKLLANIIKTVVVPAIRLVALVIRTILTPIKLVLSLIKGVLEFIQGGTKQVNDFSGGWDKLSESLKMIYSPFTALFNIIKGIIGLIKSSIDVLIEFMMQWEFLSVPIKIVESILESVGNMVKEVSNIIVNSPIGKLLGWDKENSEEEDNKKADSTKTNLYSAMKNHVEGSNMDFVTKHQILGELDAQNLSSNNINNVRNLGSTYNHNDNQKQVVINQNFAQGSMPIDARNMTKKEARKMFIGAFGYRRAVGSKGILK